MERTEKSAKFPLGSKLPEFNLKNVDGAMLGSAYLADAKAALVVFSCNHCPYVKGSDDFLQKLVARFQPQGLKVVTINSNDAGQYPEDGFDKMKEKAKALNLSHPYLYDETQAVAKLFDAECTPECFLFDGQGKLAYHGTINDSVRDPAKVKTDYLGPAIERVLAGKMPEPQFVHPIGCSIKWRR